MKRYGRLFLKILYPKAAVLLFLILISAGGLTAVFTRGMEQTAAAYAVYALSAYTTVAAVLCLISLFRRGRRRLYEYPVFQRYMTDLDFKAQISIHLSFGITVFYCICKAAAGIYYRSAWFGSMASYYIVLGVVRFLLLRHIRGGKQAEIKALRKYRFCGYLLLVLTAALSAMSFYAISGGEAVQYPGYMIYAAAGYAFYNLAMAVFNLMRYRKVKNPIYSASKVFSLASALVSLFFLQTSMFAAFGDGGAWQKYMNIGTGTAVFLTVFIMAVCMIVMGSRRIAAAVSEQGENK